MDERQEQNGQYVMVRTSQAGVFVGTLLGAEHTDVILVGARRLWEWAGAASLSELATRGTSKPRECKFPCPVIRVHLFGVIEILSVTPEARKSIEEVPVWSC